MAIVDIDAAKARLAALDAEREPLIALIRAAEAYEGAVGRTLFETAKVTIRQRAKPHGGGRASPVMDMTVEAVTPILDLLGPTTTNDLVGHLSGNPELGLGVENANNILSARLSNSGRFESRRSQGWWFKDRPWPSNEAAAQKQADYDRLTQELGSNTDLPKQSDDYDF